MRKLIESTLVSLDGVIESPEGWAIFDEEATQRSMQELDNYDAFLMGRVTYERFRENWGGGGNPYIDRIGAMPKYVASRSLTEVTWNATLLGSDVVAAIEELKTQPGKDQIKYGNSRLDATLLRAGLVDEVQDVRAFFGFSQLEFRPEHQRPGRADPDAIAAEDAGPFGQSYVEFC